MPDTDRSPDNQQRQPPGGVVEFEDGTFMSVAHYLLRGFGAALMLLGALAVAGWVAYLMIS